MAGTSLYEAQAMPKVGLESELHGLCEQMNLRWQEVSAQQTAQQTSLRELQEAHAWLRQEVAVLRCKVNGLGSSGAYSKAPAGAYFCEREHCATIEDGSGLTPSDGASPSEQADGAGQEESAAADEGLEDEEHYTFSESVWSAAIFVCTPSIGTLGSVIMVFLVCLTMVMQLLFCFVVLGNFTEEAYSVDVVEGFKAWRLSVGHNLRYMDDINGMSLVSRVCSGESSKFPHSSLELSTEQAHHVELIRSYVPSLRRDREATASERLMSGPLLCIFVLFCYYATLVQEFQDVTRMLRATAVIPRSDDFSPSKSGHLSYLSNRRFFFLVATACFRAFVGGMLFYSGTLFITQTVDMRDLLLNAVALAFVLDVDELLYGAMAPVRVRNIINKMEPLPLRRLFRPRGRRRCREHMSLGTAAILTIAIVAAAAIYLVPLVLELQAAEEALCGGRQHFVFAVDGLGTLSWTASSAEERPLGHLLNAVEEVIWANGSSSLSHPVETVPMLRVRHSQSVAEAADEGLCAGDRMTLPTRALLRELLNDSTIASCADVRAKCDAADVVGVRIRQACPQECGCDNLGKPLYHRDPSLGCSRHCAETQVWRENAPTACADMSASDLVSQYGHVLAALKNNSTGRSIAIDVLATQGCTAIPLAHARLGRNICLEPNLRPTFLALCPVSCGCQTSPTTGCPLNCFKPVYQTLLNAIRPSTLEWMTGLILGLVSGNTTFDAQSLFMPGSAAAQNSSA